MFVVSFIFGCNVCRHFRAFAEVHISLSAHELMFDFKTSWLGLFKLEALVRRRFVSGAFPDEPKPSRCIKEDWFTACSRVPLTRSRRHSLDGAETETRDILGEASRI